MDTPSRETDGASVLADGADGECGSIAIGLLHSGALETQHPAVKSVANATASSSAAPTTRPGTRVAMLAPCPFPSHQGTQVFLRHLANALVADGHAVSLLTYASAEPLDGAFIDHRIDLVRAGGAGVGTRSGPSWERIAGDGALLRRAWVRLRRERPDVLHVHNAEGLALGVVLKRTLGLPLVFHAHNALEHELPLYTNRRALEHLARFAAGRFDRSIPRLADAVICFDERQADHYASLGVAPDRLHVVPLGLDHNELHAEPSTSASPLVVYAGNPDAYQNPELIRATFTALRRRNSSARLRIISNHSPATFGDLTRDPNVHMRTFTGPAELARLIAEADVGLCTRTLWTGAPVKILSYVSAGIPVVACGEGAAMLADFPDAGLLAAPDPEALADALLAVINTRTAFDVSRMREATRIANHAQAYRDVYAAAQRTARRLLKSGE